MSQDPTVCLVEQSNQAAIITDGQEVITGGYSKYVLLLVILTMTYDKKVLVIVGYKTINKATEVIIEGIWTEPK